MAIVLVLVLVVVVVVVVVVDDVVLPVLCCGLEDVFVEYEADEVTHSDIVIVTYRL